MSKTQTVVVELGERRYDIVVGDDVLTQAGRLMAPVLHRKRVLVVTDAHVGALHLDTLHAALDDAAIEHQTVILPPGEKTKDFENLQGLLDDLLDHGRTPHHIGRLGWRSRRRFDRFRRRRGAARDRLRANSDDATGAGR